MNKRTCYILPIILLAMLVFFANGCKREYSQEGGATVPRDSIVIMPILPANFTLNGSPSTCINASVDGTYTAGSNTTSLNTITLSVNVLSPGPYVIKTDTVDQFSFVASGSFNSTGNQNVKLTASGRPDVAGLFYFMPNGDSSQCSIAIPVQSGPPYATYVLESGQNICNHQVYGTYGAGTAVTAANNVNISVYIVDLGNYLVQTDKVNGIDFSSSGTFTTKGSQTLTLFARGTPQTSGTFTFTPRIVGPAPLGGQSCGFDVNVQ